MSDDTVRAIVRLAINRHLARRRVESPAPGAARPVSFALFALPAGADAGGACLVEPTVACTHCGYCQSYGH